MASQGVILQGKSSSLVSKQETWLSLLFQEENTRACGLAKWHAGRLEVLTSKEKTINASHKESAINIFKLFSDLMDMPIERRE